VEEEEEMVNPSSPPAPQRSVRQEIIETLFYVRARLSPGTNKTLESLSFLNSQIELLEERGPIQIADLDERKKAVGERLTARLKGKGPGAMLQDPEGDKYVLQGETQIDCENRVTVFHTGCRRLSFAFSKQDVYKGLIKWDLGRPYLIDQAQNGYCAHFETDTCRTTVRESRPSPCRGYDWRAGERIRVDFDNKFANPNIHGQDWPMSETCEEGKVATA
jgi:Fe-S-cluster containining protein